MKQYRVMTKNRISNNTTMWCQLGGMGCYYKTQGEAEAKAQQFKAENNFVVGYKIQCREVTPFETVVER